MTEKNNEVNGEAFRAGGDSWLEWRRLIFSEISRFNQTLAELSKRAEESKDGVAREIVTTREQLTKKITDLEKKLTVDMELLKSRVKMWNVVFGALGGGAVSMVFSLIVWLLTKK